MGMHKSKLSPAEAFTLADAEAVVDQAKAAHSVARDAVEDAISAYPEGMRDRRMIAAMAPVGGVLLTEPDYTMHPDLREAFTRRRTFDAAIAAEGHATLALQQARDARDELRAVAETAALGDGRAALTEAIAAHAETVKAAGEARQTVERARGVLVAAQTRHSIAESALAEARERAIGAVTAMDGAPAPELKTLRRDVADAADDVEIASAALSRAELATDEPERAERKAREAVERAADAVIAVRARAAWDSLEAARNEVKRREAVFAAVAERIPSSLSEDARYLRQRRTEMIFFHDDVSSRARAAANYAWRAAHAALLRDPQAELPSLS